jgi:hypothetical protein
MNRRLVLKVVAVLSAMFPVSKVLAATNSAFLDSVYHLLLNRSLQEKYFSEHFRLSLASIYWGDIHNHTNMSSDATETLCGAPPHSLEEAFVYARDTAKLDFVAVTDHADLRSGFEITGALNNWEKYQEVLADYNDEARFVIFPGWEYTNTLGLAPAAGSATGYGHKQVIFKETTGLPAKMIGAFGIPPGQQEIEVAKTAQELWGMLGAYLPSPGTAPTALTVVHTPAMSGDGEPAHNHQTDFDAMHSDFVRNIEIYSKWGNSEGLAPDGTGCTGSDTVIDYDADYQVALKTVRSLLYAKWVQDHNPDFALGFTGSTDSHFGQPANPSLNQCGFPYRGGITGIAVSAFNRENLWQSLYDRHTIAATTDCRIKLLFAVETNGQHLLMGSVGAHNGTVRVWALADSVVEQLEIIIDGCLQETVAGCTVDKTYSLTSGYHYIYVKAVTAPSGPTTQVAWASPVYLSN